MLHCYRVYLVHRCVLLLALVVVLASVDLVSADGDGFSGKVFSSSLHDVLYITYDKGGLQKIKGPFRLRLLPP